MTGNRFKLKQAPQMTAPDTIEKTMDVEWMSDAYYDLGQTFARYFVMSTGLNA